MRQTAFPSLSVRHLTAALFLIWLITGSGTAVAADRADYMAKFARARQLVQQGDDAAASRIYQALIKLDPLEPQAYNNLAAIKARHGQLKQAQSLLEKALRSNPVYATVYENLSAIYVEMARDSYGKALHLGTPQKQVVLRELTQPSQPPQELAALSPGTTTSPLSADAPSTPRPDKKSTKLASTPAKVTGAGVASHAPVVASRKPVTPLSPRAAEVGTQSAKPGIASHKPAAKTAPRAAAATASPSPPAKPAVASEPPRATPTDQPSPASVKSTPVIVASAQPEASTTAPAQTPPQTAQAAPVQTASPDKPALLGPPDASTPSPQAQNQNSNSGKKKFEQEEVITILQGWAAAWSGKAVGLYLSFYTPDYAPHGMTHAQWAALRRQRLQAPKWIHVSLNDFQVGPVQDNTIRVRLIQKYEADNYHDLTRKLFRLRHTPDGWRIFEEKTLAKLR